MKQIRVNLVSESEFTVQGHGVHTAYLEMRHMLEKCPEVNLEVNASPNMCADVTHIHTVGIFSLKRLLSNKGGKKIISGHIIPDSLVGSIAGAKFWLPIFKCYLRWFYNRADAVIAVSPFTKQGLIKLGVKSDIVIINNTIDTALYHTTNEEKLKLRRKLNIGSDDFVVVGNGQVQPRKRFDSFVQVAKQLPNIKFIWVGGIPFKAAGADYLHLMHMIKTVPSNLTVTGVIALERAREYMRAADVMFMPSIQETFGLAIIEGAASGLPVVVRDIPDYNATFGNQVWRGDDTTFAHQIQTLRDDAKTYRHWHNAALELAKKYDSSTTLQQLLDLYKK